MDYLKHKRQNAKRRSHRVRYMMSGTAKRPRLSVHVSNLHVSAQLIDDAQAKTIAYSTTVGQKISGNLSQKAEFVGQDIAAKAKKAKVKKVVFDRGAKLYHGRVKSLAEAAKAGGLEF